MTYRECKVSRIELRSAILERAVASALDEAGCKVGAASGMVISDRPPADVVLVGDDALSCRSGLAAALDGAAHIVLAESEIDAIGPAMLAASAGCAVISRAVQSGADELGDLTDRQIDVLAAVAAGAANNEIAKRLFVSVPTVKREVSVLQQVLGARSRTALVAVGHQCGFREPLTVE